MQYVQRCSPRPWIPRLYLRMTAGLRVKLSSRGVTIKKKDPKTGKTKVPGTQPFLYTDLKENELFRIYPRNSEFEFQCIISNWVSRPSVPICSNMLSRNDKLRKVYIAIAWQIIISHELLMMTYGSIVRNSKGSQLYIIRIEEDFLILNLAQCLPFLRSGGPRLKATEEYPASFGRTLALRHLFGKDWLDGLRCLETSSLDFWGVFFWFLVLGRAAIEFCFQYTYLSQPRTQQLFLTRRLFSTSGRSCIYIYIWISFRVNVLNLSRRLSKSRCRKLKVLGIIMVFEEG